MDEQDRVYVANVYRNTGQVLIRLYDIVGLMLKERGQFNTLRLTVDRTYFEWFLSLHTCLRLLLSISSISVKLYCNWFCLLPWQLSVHTSNVKSVEHNHADNDFPPPNSGDIQLVILWLDDLKSRRLYSIS